MLVRDEEGLPSFLSRGGGHRAPLRPEDMVWTGDENLPLNAAGVLDALLTWMVGRGASDVWVQTGYRVRCECFGQKFWATRRPVSAAEAQELVNLTYRSGSGYSMLLTGRDLDYSYQALAEAELGKKPGRCRFRVNATACEAPSGGQPAVQISMRTLPTLPPRIEDLEIEPALMEHLTPHQGAVLITGMPGSGKSTLLSSVIRMIGERPGPGKNVVTYEDPVELLYYGLDLPNLMIAQAQIGRDLSDFSYGVRNATRRKPDIILVGEARDAETMRATVNAALAGFLVYGTMHTEHVPGAMRRIPGLFPSSERRSRGVEMAEALRLIVTQVLLPGVDGRQVACREFLAFDDVVRERLLDEHPDRWGVLTRRLVEERGQTMEASIRRRLKENRIDEATAGRFLRIQRAAVKDLEAEAGTRTRGKPDAAGRAKRGDCGSE